MNKEQYQEKLKSPEWQRRRLLVLEAADWKCELCKNGHDTLHVHHLEYIEGREPWDYEDEMLIVVCEGCHEAIHFAKYPGKVVQLLKLQFQAGERYAVTMLGMHEEGSDERLKYLKGLIKD